MCRSFLVFAAFCAVYAGVAPVSVRANDDEKKVGVAKTTTVPDAAAITKIGVSLNTAFARHDSKLFRALTASDFTYVCSACNGKTENLAGEQAIRHAASWVIGGATAAMDATANVTQFYTIEDTNAQADSVVLTMKQEVEYATDSDKTFTYATRQTWVRTGDGWKLKSLVRL